MQFAVLIHTRQHSFQLFKYLEIIFEVFEIRHEHVNMRCQRFLTRKLFNFFFLFAAAPAVDPAEGQT